VGIKKKLLKIAGKDDFALDDNISTRYLIGICWKYGWMLIRGHFFAFGRKKISNDIFVGSHVKIREKRKLTIGHKVKLHDGCYIDGLSNSWGGYSLEIM